MTPTPDGALPMGVFNRWLLAGLCFALAIGTGALIVNEWLIEREVAG